MILFAPHWIIIKLLNSKHGKGGYNTLRKNDESHDHDVSLVIVRYLLWLPWFCWRFSSVYNYIFAPSKCIYVPGLWFHLTVELWLPVSVFGFWPLIKMELNSFSSNSVSTFEVAHVGRSSSTFLSSFRHKVGVRFSTQFKCRRGK